MLTRKLTAFNANHVPLDPETCRKETEVSVQTQRHATVECIAERLEFSPSHYSECILTTFAAGSGVDKQRPLDRPPESRRRIPRASPPQHLRNRFRAHGNPLLLDICTPTPIPQSLQAERPRNIL